MARLVTIYAIRDIETCEVRYVGQTTNLSRRKATGYLGAVQTWLNAINWEYMPLEYVALGDAAQAEQWWIDYLAMIGCDLLNIAKARPSSARPMAPLSTSGTKWTEADYEAHGYGRLSLRLQQELLGLLKQRAMEWGCSRAEALELLLQSSDKTRPFITGAIEA